MNSDNRAVMSVWSNTHAAAHSHRSNLIHPFTVLDSTEVNGFALPGGHVYIARGLLADLNTEVELVAVLGHEIGHVTAQVRSQAHELKIHLQRATLGTAARIRPAVHSPVIIRWSNGVCSTASIAMANPFRVRG